MLIATDAWRPQINGVVHTYERLASAAVEFGVEIVFLTPSDFKTIPCPTYPEIRLAVPGYKYVLEHLDVVAPDAFHIATEGPIGWMVRRYCIRRGFPFTTAFHTRFPEYISERFGVPASWIYAIERSFHNRGSGIMVASRSLANELEKRAFKPILPWTRGVDTAMFYPRDVRRFGTTSPVFIYVGRVAVEKNIEAFLKAKITGQKVVVGTGPMLDELRCRYPDVTFTGKLTGQDLAEAYASADVFVFPSLTDTFGIVLIEAMASGLPVAAYPVTGPIDNVRHGVSGILDQDLSKAAVLALELDRDKVREHALNFSWKTTAKLFIENIETAIFSREGRQIPGRRKSSILQHMRSFSKF
ncbi:MAG TPA: GDP-mannose-dependent alpha-mannosyltransferase [Hyphomicrobiaceae bacterium MAG_BT-2024]